MTETLAVVKMSKYLQSKIEIFSYPSAKTYVLGAQKNRLIETVILDIQSICFGRKIKKRFIIMSSNLDAWLRPWFPETYFSNIPDKEIQLTLLIDNRLSLSILCLFCFEREKWRIS